MCFWLPFKDVPAFGYEAHSILEKRYGYPVVISNNFKKGGSRYNHAHVFSVAQL